MMPRTSSRTTGNTSTNSTAEAPRSDDAPRRFDGISLHQPDGIALNHGGPRGLVGHGDAAGELHRSRYGYRAP